MGNLESGVRALAQSPNGRLLATADTRGIQLWELPGGKMVPAWKNHLAREILALSFSPDSSGLTSGGEDVRLWDVTSGNQSRQVAHGGKISALARSPDGKLLAAAREDGSILLLNPATGDLVRSLGTNASVPTALAFSPDGLWLAVGARDLPVRLHSMKTDRDPVQLDGLPAFALAFTPDGRTLCTGMADGKVRLWETASRTEIGSFTGHWSTVQGLACSTNNRLVFSGSWDSTILVWDLAPVLGNAVPGIRTCKNCGPT